MMEFMIIPREAVGCGAGSGRAFSGAAGGFPGDGLLGDEGGMFPGGGFCAGGFPGDGLLGDEGGVFPGGGFCVGGMVPWGGFGTNSVAGSWVVG